MVAALQRISAPAITPVSLAEAKLHLRVDHTYEDSMIEKYLEAAVDWVDGDRGFLGRALIDQTWELTIDKFPANEIMLPLPPLIEVLSVKYDDGAGVEQTLAPIEYTVDAESEPGWVLPDGSWPATFDGINAVRIRYRAGYVDTTMSPATGTVPADIQNAILLLTGELYANRETSITGAINNPLSWSAEQLLRRRRVYLGIA